MNIVLIAEESAGIQALRTIHATGHRIQGVLTSIAKVSSSGASVSKAAASMGLQLWPAESVKRRDFAEILISLGVDIILNVHSLFLINPEILRVPTIGAFNLHPGLLPRYAGLNTVSWAIYRGEKSHGVTLHRMMAEVDTGPIVYQSTFPISETDSALAVSATCVREGIAMIGKLLEVAAQDPSSIPSIPQDLSQREYFGRQTPEHGHMNWNWPAEKIVNFVRACDYYPFQSPWGHPITRLKDIDIAVIRAERTGQVCDRNPGTVGAVQASGILVAGSDEWILLTKMKIGNKYQNPSDLLKTGMQFEANFAPALILTATT